MLVVVFTPGSAVFLPPHFTPSSKTNACKFQFNLETVHEWPLCGCATANYLLNLQLDVHVPAAILAASHFIL